MYPRPAENRRPQQKRGNRVGEVPKDLPDQAIDDVPVVRVEPGDEVGNILTTLDGERSELEPGNLPFRPLLQRIQMLCGQIPSRYLVDVGG